MDAAFPTAPYPGYTSAELQAIIDRPTTIPEVAAKMRAEVERREKVANGDMSVATPGGRLRAVRLEAERL